MPLKNYSRKSVGTRKLSEDSNVHKVLKKALIHTWESRSPCHVDCVYALERSRKDLNSELRLMLRLHKQEVKAKVEL